MFGYVLAQILQNPFFMEYLSMFNLWVEKRQKISHFSSNVKNVLFF